MYKVKLSDRAYASILLETNERISTETGGIFLGKVVGDTFYVAEVLDPGPNSVFHMAYFEYDVPYVNHLAKKVARQYLGGLDVIGLWHRHPGSFSVFSGTDDATNKRYAEMNKYGAISALVNIDPVFRMTMYYVDEYLQYPMIEYEVGDISDICPLRDFSEIERELNENNVHNCSISINDVVSSFRGVDHVGGILPHNSDDIDSLLDLAFEDIEYLTDRGFKTVCKFNNGCLVISSEYCPSVTLSIFFGIDGACYLTLLQKTCPYRSNLIKNLVSGGLHV